MMKTSASKILTALIRPLIVAAVVALPMAAQAASGTWTDVNPNDWSNANTASWLGGVIADGSGNTADFSTINLPADISVNVVDPRTIGNMTFGDTEIATTPASWSLSGANITLAGGTPTITVGTLGTTKTVTINDILAGTTGLTKAGAGELVLGGVNTFTGGLNITGGRVTMTGGTIPGQSVVISNGGTWAISSNWGLTTNAGNPPVPFDPAAGSVYVPAGQTATLQSNSTLSVAQVGGGAGSTLNVVIGNSGGTFNARGNWNINGTAAGASGSNIGTLNVSVGTPGNTGNFALAANSPTSNQSRFLTSSFLNTAVNITDGATLYTRTNSTGNTIDLGSLSGTTGAILEGGAVAGGTFANYSIGALNTNTEFAGTITSEFALSAAVGTTNITKVGTGKLTLSGTLNYTPSANALGALRRGGITTVVGGTLALKNLAQAPAGSDPAGTGVSNLTTIDVRSGATLDVSGTTLTYLDAGSTTVTGYSTNNFQQVIGTGTIVGNYNHGTGFLAPANTINASGSANTVVKNNVVAGTIAFANNLSFAGTGVINFDLANSPAGLNDLIQVGGGDMSGTPKLALNFLTTPGPGTFTIVNSTSAALTGSLAGWSVDFNGRGSAPNLAFSPDHKQVLLTIGANSFGTINWRGDNGGVWDTATANWHNPTSATNPDKFFQSDNVNFLDTYNGTTAPANTTAITLDITAIPSSVTFNNTTVAYSISGSGKISGSTSLVKNGTGALTLSTANDYSGGTAINAGNVDLGSTGVLGTGAVTLAGGEVTATGASNFSNAIVAAPSTTSILHMNSAANQTLGAISGSGTIEITSDTPGKTVTLAANNPNLTGVLRINAADPTVVVRMSNSATAASGARVIVDSGVLANGQNGAGTATIGSLEGGPNGTLSGYSGGSSSTTGGEKTWDIGSLGLSTTFAGKITNGKLATNIIKSGAGSLTLSGNNTFTGTTVVNGGTLVLSHTNALQNSALTPGGAGVVFDSLVDPHAFNIGGLNGAVNLPLVDNGGNPIAVTIGGTSQNISSTYNGVLSGNGASLTKQGTGTFTLGGNNTYNGPTTINGGTVRLGAADRIANSSNLTLNGGTFATQGFSETLGTLLMNGTGTIDLGNGASQLHFADSHLQPWVSTLTVNNYSLADAIFVGTNASGLDSTQLSLVTFAGFNPGAVISSTGQLNPAGAAVTALGDVNRDGVITAADVGAMLRALTDLSAYQANYILTAQDVKNIADVNFDGVVNNFDIQAQLDMIANLGLGSVSAVPEPTSLGLLALGGILLFRVRRNRA
jgi:fibronectin-binding autotransporter adhesin